MARRRTKNLQRPIQPDVIYQNQDVSKFITSMMLDGKKSISEKVFYKSLEVIKLKTNNDGFQIFLQAIENIKPVMEVKSRRVGGSTYQVPIKVSEVRQRSLSIRWLLNSARSRNGKSMAQKLAAEFMDASKSLGGAFKKKEDVKRMAEANKAFSHYAW